MIHIGKTKILIVFMVIAAVAFSSFAIRQKKKKESQPRYKVGVVDLMILKRQKLGAIPLARELGADGIELDMGGLGKRPAFDNQLANDSIRQLFIDKAKECHIEFASLSMSGFYAQSFPTRDGVERMVGDCIHTMKQLGVKVAFLPLGVEGDLKKYPERRDSIVVRLKRVGKLAEKAGVVIGIETALSAAEEVKLLDEIGSPAVQVYFNFSIPLKEGRDLCSELKILGKKRICMIHATDEDGVWLQHNTRIDMPRVKATLDEMGWCGWLMVERSRDASNPRDVKGNFGANVTYLKSIFQKIDNH